MHLAQRVAIHPTRIHPATGLDDAPALDAREICEFMAGDDPPVNADPRFKDRLREHLWEMVSARSASGNSTT
jgi:hypothetical protein